MAEEQPSLHIDTDWKKQAQEEKRKLAEEAEKKKEQERASAPAGGPAPSATASAGPGPSAPRGRGGALPPASFGALVQSLVTQVLFYLGDVTPRGVEPQINLDMAK